MWAAKDWNLFIPWSVKRNQWQHGEWQGIKTMSSETRNHRNAMSRLSLEAAVPMKAEELNILPEYIGPDAVHIYSDDELPVFWTDPVGDHWWLVQRPDGSYAKLPMDV